MGEYGREVQTMHDYFEVEVSLREVEPRVWRRFMLEAKATFQDLHEAIQVAAGWWNYHLFAFRDAKTGRAVAGIPDDEYGEPDPDARRVKLATWLGKAGRKACLYEYDFGDSWEHDVVVRPAEHADVFERRLLDGERAFPHEDSGGTGGYERYCRIVLEGVDPWNEPIEESLAWLEGWHPDKFELTKAKRAFDRPRVRSRAPKGSAKGTRARSRK